MQVNVRLARNDLFYYNANIDAEDNRIEAAINEITNICDCLCAILRVLYKQRNPVIAIEPEYLEEYNPQYSSDSVYEVTSSDADLFYVPPEWYDNDFVDVLPEYETPVTVKQIQMSGHQYNELPEYKNYIMAETDIMNSTSKQDIDIDQNLGLTEPTVVFKILEENEDGTVTEKITKLVKVGKKEKDTLPVFFAAPKESSEPSPISTTAGSFVSDNEIPQSSDSNNIKILSKIMRTVEGPSNEITNEGPAPSDLHVKSDGAVQRVDMYKKMKQPKHKGPSDADLIDALQYVMNEFKPEKTLAESYYQVMSKLVKLVGFQGLIRINDLLTIADSFNYNEKPNLIKKICGGSKMLCLMGYYDGINIKYTKLID